MADDEKQEKTVIIPAPIWLLSFGDTVALMLAFFVMLFAMSSVEDSNVSKLIAAITSDAPQKTLSRPVPNSNFSIENVKIYNGLSLNYIYQLIEEKISNVEALKKVTVENKTESVLISLPMDIFVSSTNPSLTENGKKAIFELALILAPFSNLIQVEGHNPPMPVSPENPFSNRWEMMLQRSSSVAQEIRRSGLLASTKILGWSMEEEKDAHKDHGSSENTNHVDIRITKIAGGQ